MRRIPGCGSLHVSSEKIANNLGLSLRNVSKVYLLPIILAMTVAFLPGVAATAEKILTPGISVGGAYDDNIRYAPENKLDSWIATVSPRLNYDYQTLVSNLRLEGEWDILRYLDESDFDRTNQYYRLYADHRIKERWTTSGDFRFYRDTSLNSYLQETGRVVERIERDYLDAGARVGYNMTTISSVSAAYRYQNTTYDSDDFSDYDNHRANLNYHHRLKSQVDTLSIGPSYYHRTNDFNEVDSYAINLGWDRDWSSISSSEASIGARYANVKRNDGTEDDSWGAKANIEFNYTGIVSSTTFRYFHDLRTTADGDDVNVDNIHLTYRRLITERFGAGFEGRLVFSYKLVNQQSDLNDERYYRLEPRIFYRLTENLNISLRYRYQNNIEFKDEGDETRERNIFWLQFGYELPFLL